MWKPPNVKPDAPPAKDYYCNVGFVEDEMYNPVADVFRWFYPEFDPMKLAELIQKVESEPMPSRSEYPVTLYYDRAKEFQLFLVTIKAPEVFHHEEIHIIFLTAQPLVGISLSKVMDILDFEYPQRSPRPHNAGHNRRIMPSDNPNTDRRKPAEYVGREKPQHKNYKRDDQDYDDDDGDERDYSQRKQKERSNKEINVQNNYQFEKEDDPTTFKDRDGATIRFDDYTEKDKHGKPVHCLKYIKTVSKNLEADDVRPFYVNDMDKGAIWKCEVPNMSNYMKLHFYRCNFEIRVSRWMKAQGKKTFFEHRMDLDRTVGYAFRNYLLQNPSAKKIWQECWEQLREWCTTPGNPVLGKWTSTSDEKQAKHKKRLRKRRRGMNGTRWLSLMRMTCSNLCLSIICLIRSKERRRGGAQSPTYG